MYRLPLSPHTPPKCPDCNGTGRTEYDGHLPRTCDRCQGRGVYVNPVAVIVSLALIVITTLAPFGFVWLFK